MNYSRLCIGFYDLIIHTKMETVSFIKSSLKGMNMNLNGENDHVGL